MKAPSHRLFWVDLAKFIAVLAIIVDHLHFYIYNNEFVSAIVYYSVTLFVMLSGVTQTNSFVRNKRNPPSVIKRLSRILIPYGIASLIYHIYINNYTLDVFQFIRQLFLFNVTPAFYYLFIYIQLTLISPFMIQLFLHKKLHKQLIYLVVVFIISVLFTDRTSMFGMLGGANKLLGGTFLFAYSLGIVFFTRINSIGRKTLFGMGLISLGMLAVGLYGKTYQTIKTNPPNVNLILYSICIFFLCFLVGKFLGKFNKSFIIKTLSFLGERSFYIYLYHALAISIAVGFVQKGFIPIVIHRQFIFLSALIFPMLIFIVLRIGKNILENNLRQNIRQSYTF